MWKHFVEPDRPQMTIWRMRIACWITESTDGNTNSEYVILIAFPPQERFHERALMLRYTNIACLISYSLIAKIVSSSVFSLSFVRSQVRANYEA